MSTVLPQILSICHDPKTIPAVITILVSFAVAKRYIDRRSNDVPRLRKVPGAHWLWGHEFTAWKTPNADWYLQNTEKYGHVVAMKGALFHPDILALSDPGALHYIYQKRQMQYIKSLVMRPLIERTIGRGLVWVEGEDHKSQRQHIAPVFGQPKMRAMDDVVRAASVTLVEKLRDHALSSATKDAAGVQVDMLEWSTEVTLQIIGLLGFGFDFRFGESAEAKAIHEAWSDLFGVGMSFTGFVAPLVIRAFPWITSIPVDSIQAQGKVKTLIKDICRNIVKNQQKAVDGGEHDSGDLLSALMSLYNVHDDAELDELLDQACTFVIAGHETTSNSIALTLWSLACQKDTQEALRQEIMQFKGTGAGGEPSYDELLSSKLPMLDAVCKEGLRMWPIGGHAERVALEDDVIPLRFPIKDEAGEEVNSIRIKRGQVFYIPYIAINRNTYMWGPDGHIFDPRRWIEPGRLPPVSRSTGGINGHFTFIEGPRLCPGYRLAILELKVALLKLVKNFEFSSTGDIQTVFSMTLQPFVAGEKEKGPRLPLFVRPLDLE